MFSRLASHTYDEMLRDDIPLGERNHHLQVVIVNQWKVNCLFIHLSKALIPQPQFN